MNRKILNLIAACTLTVSTNLHAMYQASSVPTDISVGKALELITGVLRAPAASMVTKNEFTNPERAKQYQILASSMRITNALLSAFNGSPLRTNVNAIDFLGHVQVVGWQTSTNGLGLGAVGFLISDCVELVQNCVGKTPEALTGDALTLKQRYEVTLHLLHSLEGFLAGGCALTNGISFNFQDPFGQVNIKAQLTADMVKNLYPHGLLSRLLTTVRLVEKMVKQHRDNQEYVLLGGLTAVYVVKALGDAVIMSSSREDIAKEASRMGVR
jgi:hypothetical protein